VEEKEGEGCAWLSVDLFPEQGRYCQKYFLLGDILTVFLARGSRLFLELFWGSSGPEASRTPYWNP
jgi:hypothetical protein